MSDRIPDEHAQILWCENEEGKVSDICVVDYRDTELQEQMAKEYTSSNGADTAGWLSEVNPIANPAGLFAYLAFRCSFETAAVAMECVREFASIENCEWARKMLAAMERAD
jgi:hypothetical protein